MYQVKDIGGGAVVLFDASMRDQAERRLELERELSPRARPGPAVT
jgi:hypothetical protein